MDIIYRKDKRNIIYATLIDDGITVCFENGAWIESFPYWILGNEELYKIILEEEVKIDKPYQLLNDLHEKYVKEKNDKDYFKKFVLSFIDYVKDDYYKMFHNNKKNLIYSAKELDLHYENCGYYDMFNDYYEDYLNRKEIYPFNLISVIKEEDDYIIVFNKKILEK